jgi:NhaP-type Na+/H+ or K+/H+ antiporter
MHLDPLIVTAAVAVVAGVVGQAIARHLKVPAILPLLLAGVILGPSSLGVIDPASLGQGLKVLVGFAVAIILFEGGMSLKAEALRSAGRTIRNLVTIGALLTWAGAAALAWKFFPGLGVGPSILFGALVIVTGPTVIGPLLKVVRPRQRVANVLRGEAILIDPIGALYAVLVLEFLVEADKIGGAAVLVAFGERIVLGIGLGGAGAALLYFILKKSSILDRDLHSLAVLAGAIGLYALSESVIEESGVLTVTLAGFGLGWLNPPGLEEVEHFKGQLTVLMVSIVFVLLSANVELSGVVELGWPGVALVTLLMLVVRPATIFACTLGTELTTREKLFLSWIAPRGIIAAAVSSLFALSLAANGMAEGRVVMNLTFAVIAGTVLIQAPTARWVGRALGVLEGTRNGFLLVGANRVARGLGRALDRAGLQVQLVDTSAWEVRKAREEGLNARRTNAIDPREVDAFEAPGIGQMIALTPNDGVNRLAVKLYAHELGPEHVRAIRLANSPPEEENGIAPLYLLDPPLTWEELRRLFEAGYSVRSAEVDEALPVERFGELFDGGVPLLALDGERLPRFLRSDSELEVGDLLFFLAPGDPS